MANTCFISCDWGTTSFRLKLVDTVSMEVKQAIEIPQGIKQTFQEWQLSGNKDRVGFFLDKLQAAIHEMETLEGIHLNGHQVVISGMASASIGIKELSYSALPFPLDGSQAVVEYIPAGSNCGHDVLLVSGVAKPGDVMRGEEVQAIGWNHVSAFMPDKCILVLPGTHSKHLLVEDGQVVDFKTYMTGELFQVMQTHSILRSSVDFSPVWDREAQRAFSRGVEAGRLGNLANQLFSIRARTLQADLNTREAFHFLSGLLIGNEFKEGADWPVVLCGTQKFQPLYSLALEVLGLQKQTIPISAQSVENLMVWGQMSILEHLK